MPPNPPVRPIAPLPYSAVLTHHWLVRIRGGEKVLEALAELVPEAPLYTLVHDPAGMGASPLARREIHSSVIQCLPGATRYYPKLLPLLPWAARRIQLPPVDLVLCSDAALAKAMRPHPRSRVVCYCHSPMRYAFDSQISAAYRRTLPVPLRPFWRPLSAYVRRADCRAAERVDQFVANSQHVARRIREWYGRESVVIYPPVDLPAAPATGRREDFCLCVGHHVAYKRLDLAVAACRQLGRRLVVIGDGPEVARLRADARAQVTWLGHQPDDVLHDHYRRAAALVFPGEEDFGLVPVEAIAHGCPVVAFGVGGAAETVVHERTGVLFTPQTTAALAGAIQRCTDLRFPPERLHQHVQAFGRRRFLEEMRSLLMRVLAGDGTTGSDTAGPISDDADTLRRQAPDSRSPRK